MSIKCKVEFTEENCISCGLCVSCCPRKILFIDEKKVNGNGYHPAGVIDTEKCIGCGSCNMICPNGVITLIKE